MKKTKLCKYCDSEFTPATYTTKLCDNCKGTKKNNYKVVRVKEICKCCDHVFGEVERNVTKAIVLEKRVKVCDICWERNKVLRSNAKRGILNPNANHNTQNKKKHFITIFDESLCKAVKQINENGILRNIIPRPEPTIKIRRERGVIVDELRERMRNCNPMHDSVTVERMKRTLRERITDGTIVYKTGPEHHNWKGTREHSARLRMFTFTWKKACLQRANYKCELCESKKYLEVHHIEGFKDIVENFIKKPLKEYDISTQEFEDLGKEIKEYHENNLDIGLVVCLNCHVKIDKHRNYSLPHYVHQKYQTSKIQGESSQLLSCQ